MERQNEETPVNRIGNEIDLKTAAKWTKYSRQRQVPGETISHLFGRDIIEKILNQKDCSGLRIYYANSKPLSVTQRLVLILINFLRDAAQITGEKHLIIAGTSSVNKDLIPGTNNQLPNKAVTQPEPQLRNLNTGGYDDYILAEQAVPCPGTEGCPNNELTS
ncbi:hypothetical protein [Mucilaginibacter arboris]|uniref:Uncharacterized protein n=1 Tax=Mucilaginibacter arboris TaxID=2682090 RepID=A0A7K1STP6_9SPHI|nr:hypothetical protein [Mucilaginibacter arboris]MVN20654.1 hypothetical protein [Mucilaginibacter arboris]